MPNTPRTIIFKKWTAYGPHGDIATIPLIYNKWTTPPDTHPMLPATLVHDKFVGHEVMPREEWMEVMEGMAPRSTSDAEDRWVGRGP